MAKVRELNESLIKTVTERKPINFDGSNKQYLEVYRALARESLEEFERQLACQFDAIVSTAEFLRGEDKKAVVEPDVRFKVNLSDKNMLDGVISMKVKTIKESATVGEFHYEFSKAKGSQESLGLMSDSEEKKKEETPAETKSPPAKKAARKRTRNKGTVNSKTK